MNIVLVEPEIPQNTGTTGRLCAITNATLHLVGRLGFSLDEKKVRRAGLDYWPHLKMKTHETIESFKKDQPGRYFLFTTHAKRLYTDVAFQPGDYLIFGRESGGLPKEWIEAAGENAITIPMFHPEVRSINLATSVGIALYEALRQTGFQDHMINQKPASESTIDE